jgi:organic hydroperoxide reductase OsmC/OhrA
MATTHHFQVLLNSGVDHANRAIKPRQAQRDHRLEVAGKPPLLGSAAPSFHGDNTKWNPEELFAAALAQCHFLSLVYVADRDGWEIESVELSAEAVLEIDAEGGQITQVALRPRTTVGPTVAPEVVIAAHHEAEKLCFIARSVSCEVVVEPEVIGGSTRDIQV